MGVLNVRDYSEISAVAAHKVLHLVVHDSLTPVVKVFTHLGDAGIMWVAIAVLLLRVLRSMGC